MKKKIQFKAMYLLIIMVMCIPQIQYAKNTKPKSTPGTAIFVMAQSDQTLIVKDKTFRIQMDGLNLDMHIPQFLNLQDTDFQKQLNHKLLKEACEQKKKIVQIAKDYNKDFEKYGLTPIPFEYIETFSIIPSVYPNYTVEVYKYQYSGGAHGISELSYINLNQASSRLVTLEDLFKEQVDYISIINQFVRQEIERRRANGEFFFSGSDGFQTITANQPFFINKDGDLVIVFNVYEIAPYASGAIYINISESQLRPYLK